MAFFKTKTLIYIHPWECSEKNETVSKYGRNGGIADIFWKPSWLESVMNVRHKKKTSQ